MQVLFHKGLPAQLAAGHQLCVKVGYVQKLDSRNTFERAAELLQCRCAATAEASTDQQTSAAVPAGLDLAKRLEAATFRRQAFDDFLSAPSMSSESEPQAQRTLSKKKDMAREPLSSTPLELLPKVTSLQALGQIPCIGHELQAYTHAITTAVLALLFILVHYDKWLL